MTHDGESRVIPGYGGFMPQYKQTFATTFGHASKSCMDRKDGAVISQVRRSEDGTRHVTLAGTATFPGPSFLGQVRPDPSGSVKQGSSVNLSNLYKSLVTQGNESAIKNMSSVPFGDPYYFNGSHMYETTYRETYPKGASDELDKFMADSMRRSINPSKFKRMELDLQYKELAQSVGSRRLLRLEAETRDLLSQHDGVPRLRTLFMQNDVDGSGLVDVNGFLKVMELFGVSLGFKEANALFGQHDIHRKGVICYDDFVSQTVQPGMLRFQNNVSEFASTHAQQSMDGTTGQFARLGDGVQRSKIELDSLYSSMETAVGRHRMVRMSSELRNLLLGRDRIQRLRTLFRQADMKGSGLVTASDFHRVLEQFGFRFKWKECLALFGTYDHDRTGKVSYEELFSLVPETFHTFGPPPSKAALESTEHAKHPTQEAILNQSTADAQHLESSGDVGAHAAAHANSAQHDSKHAAAAAAAAAANANYANHSSSSSSNNNTKLASPVATNTAAAAATASPSGTTAGRSPGSRRAVSSSPAH